MTNKNKEKSFVLILNDIKVDGTLPIEIAPGHLLQKANSEQIARIKKAMLQFTPSLPFGMLQPPYECEIIKTSGEKPGNFHYGRNPLSKSEWRYWVIEFIGSNAEIEYIEHAAALLEHNLEIGFTFMHNGLGWHALNLFSFFEDMGFGEPAVTIKDKELYEIKENYELVKKISKEQEHEHIYRSLRKLRDLRSLPRQSELVVVVLFSVIESLITHRPKFPDLSDSLGHQIKTKMSLLRKKFQRPLNHNDYFKTMSETNTWSKLYEYRSKLVHSVHLDLSRELMVLETREKIIEFLSEAVKLLLLLAMKDPVFITDLKEC